MLELLVAGVPGELSKKGSFLRSFRRVGRAQKSLELSLGVGLGKCGQ